MDLKPTPGGFLTAVALAILAALLIGHLDHHDREAGAELMPLGAAPSPPPGINSAAGGQLQDAGLIPAGDGTIAIAMDPTCPWCQRQHAETAALRAQGWRVEYLPYPRAGVESPAGRALAHAHCAGSLETADLWGGVLPSFDGDPCPAGVAWVREGRNRVTALGINATPTLIVNGGDPQPGYRTAASFGSPR